MNDLRALERRLARPARFAVVGQGEASWDQVWRFVEAPHWGGKARATAFDELGGGQVATAMVACRRLGLSAAWIGKLGDDPAGRAILDGLAAEGVDVSAVMVVPGATSHAAVIVVDGQGERTVLYREGPILCEADVSVSAVTSGRVLHVDGNFLGAAIVAARAARAEGRVVSCDLERVEERTAELVELVDVCIASPAVPPLLTGEADLERALRRLLDRGPTIAGVTLGARGALACDGAGSYRQRAIGAGGAGAIVDTTACGDTFRAGFLAALLDGWNTARALAFAAAAAGLKTRALGRRGCPTRAEVEAIVARDAGEPAC